MAIRLTHATALILQALATNHRHGFQIMDVTRSAERYRLSRAP